jgi:hypothetical protein
MTKLSMARDKSSLTGAKITTYSVMDAKLKKLIVWYHHHKMEISPIDQDHQDRDCLRHNLCLRQLKLLDIDIGIDISKMRYSEKKDWIKMLSATKKTWNNYKMLDNSKQQPITKFFKPKKDEEKARHHHTTNRTLLRPSNC